VPLGLEGDLLHVTVSTMRTILVQLGEPKATQPVAETQMPQVCFVVVVRVHLPAAKGAYALSIILLKLAMQ